MVILAAIVINAIILGIATSGVVMTAVGDYLMILDRVLIAFFVAEMAIKIVAYGISFFRSPWNVFDLLIVGISVVPAGENLTVLRGLRVIRALRILSAVPQLRGVIKALLDALPGMGAVILLLTIVFYVFGVMATLLYGETFPQWFGTLGESLYTLFQIMTLESWSMGIVRPVMETHPNSWAFFVPFIVVTAFAVLNLFIGLLVNTMQSAVEAEGQKEIEKLERIMEARTAELSGQIAELKDLLERERQGRDD
jgi:voltage-gated sodium channel